MQRAEMEELRQRDANLTALQAIGPRKKPKLEEGASASTTVRMRRKSINFYTFIINCARLLFVRQRKNATTHSPVCPESVR